MRYSIIFIIISITIVNSKIIEQFIEDKNKKLDFRLAEKNELLDKEIISTKTPYIRSVTDIESISMKPTANVSSNSYD
jgi:hypothetical protein